MNFMKKLLITFLVCLALANLISLSDYETVSIAENFRNPVSRKEMLIIAGIFTLFFYLVSICIRQIVAQFGETKTEVQEGGASCVRFFMALLKPDNGVKTRGGIVVN